MAPNRERKMLPELAEAIDKHRISLAIGYALCRKSHDEQRELLPKAIEVTAFLRKLNVHSFNE